MQMFLVRRKIVDGLGYRIHALQTGVTSGEFSSSAALHICDDLVGVGAGLLGELVRLSGVVGIALGHAGQFFQGGAGLLDDGGLIAGAFGQHIAGPGDLAGRQLHN